MNRLEIDIYSDIGCPWCFIGTRRLRAVVDSLPAEIGVEVRHHPYMLNPGAPPEGTDVHAMLAEKYGGDPTPMFARVEAAARDAGIPLDLSRQRYAFDTAAAHTLLRHAEHKGTQAELADALFVAYFLEARNVSDTEVLVAVAGAHGFTAAEVERLVHDEAELALTRLEAQDATRNGIRGVPFFILNDRYSLSGAQPPEIFREAIARALVPAADDGGGSGGEGEEESAA